MVSLISARATKIEVINNLTESKEINIDIENGFSVSYAEDGEHCGAILNAGFKMQGHPDTLTVLCTIVGDFATQKISSTDDKKKIHVECYYALFPYAQALVARLCTDAGLPPFYVQALDMNPENVIVKE